MLIIFRILLNEIAYLSRLSLEKIPLLTLLSKERDNLDFARNSTDEVPEEPHPPQNTP